MASKEDLAKALEGYTPQPVLGQVFSGLDEVKKRVKNWFVNPRENLYQMDQDAKRFMAKPAEQRAEEIVLNAGGAGVIKAAGASLVQRMQALVKSGLSVSDAAKAVGIFPVVGKQGQMAGYAEAIPTVAGRLPETAVMDVMSGRPNMRLQDFYEGAELDKLLRYAPESANVPTRATLVARDEKAGGSFFRGDPSWIEANARSFQGPYGVRGLIAHEGTHAVQKEQGLAHGGNAKIMAPSVEAHTATNPEAAVLLKELSRQRTDPVWTGYRSIAGEEAANMAKKSAIGHPMAFDTPLALQINKGEEFLSPEYIRKYRILQELKARGQFDPAKSPMELPPGWEGLYPPK